MQIEAPLRNDGAVQIVAPIGRDAELLASFLETAGLAVCNASENILDMSPEDRDGSGPLLIAEEALTPQLIARLSELLNTQPFWSDLPLLVLTTAGRETRRDIERQRQRLPLGHLTLLERPLRPASLLSAVEAAVRARARQYEIRDTSHARDEAIEALRASEEQSRSILRSTRDCIELLDLEGTVLSVNGEAQARLGLPVASAACGASWLSFWQGKDRLEAERAMAAAREGSEGRFEASYQTANGEHTWWDVSVAPVRGSSDAVDHLLAVSRDVSARKRTEEALVRSEKLAAVGRLASSIAHEINNPLESVTNLLYLARQQASSPETQQYLESADQELRRVSVIANQTLRFHRQSSLPRAVSAIDLFATVLSIYEGRLKNSGIRVETDFRAKHPVLCFEGDVRQVLNNLVGNAIDAMNTGGRLLLRSHDVNYGKGPGMVLTVADTGKGMPPQVLAKLFEPFFTTKGISGTGLGLWVSKEVVTRHDGTLTVRSREAAQRHGTVFRFFLPHRRA